MGGFRTVRTSGTLCAYCGTAERLIVETERLVIDRCYTCGDESVRSRAEAADVAGHAAELVGAAPASPSSDAR